MFNRIFIGLLTFLLATTAFAQVEVELTQLLTGLNQPTAIEAPRDGSNRLFICQKGGRIRIFDLTTQILLPTDFISIANRINTQSERGLLGLAFHPDFANNGQLFISYSANGSFGGYATGTSVFSRLTLANPSDNTTDLSSEEIILTVNQDFSNHNGGHLAFGPDGYLYIGMGDGGSGGDPNGRGQQTTSMLGKMLRIDVDNVPSGATYGIPPDNPFLSNSAILDEIWATGLRNPWRYSFDRATGDLWIADVGQNAREEINFEPANSGGGFNYGWNCREGLIAYSNPSAACNNAGTLVDPIADFSHNSPTMGAASITGGYVYRGRQWPELQGTYICADFATNNLFTIRPDGNNGWAVSVQRTLPIGGVTTFGQDEEDELYLADFNGRLYKVSGGEPSSLIDPLRQASFSLSLAPNPADTEVYLKINNIPQPLQMEGRLYNLQGQLVHEQSWEAASGEHTARFSIAHLPAAVYHLVVTSAIGGRSVKLVKVGKG